MEPFSNFIIDLKNKNNPMRPLAACTQLSQAIARANQAVVSLSRSAPSLCLVAVQAALVGCASLEALKGQVVSCQY